MSRTHKGNVYVIIRHYRKKWFQNMLFYLFYYKTWINDDMNKYIKCYGEYYNGKHYQFLYIVRM
jgi:hypothetical protein